MKAVNNETGRAVGGFSFTDSIVRTNIPTEGYVEYIIEKINRELLKGSLALKSVKGSKYIQFFLGDRKLLWLKPAQVEQYRRENATMLERILIANMESLGYPVDKETKYYTQLWGN